MPISAETIFELIQSDKLPLEMQVRLINELDGPEINAFIRVKPKAGSPTAIHWIARFCRPEILKALWIKIPLAVGARGEEKDDKRIASPKSLDDIFKLRDKDGCTLLHLFAWCQSTILADLFHDLTEKVSPKILSEALLIQEREGFTPLGMLISKPFNSDAFQCFFSKFSAGELSKAVVLKNNLGSSPLHIITSLDLSAKDLSIIETFINRLSAASLNLILGDDECGQTVLFTSAMRLGSVFLTLIQKVSADALSEALEKVDQDNNVNGLVAAATAQNSESFQFLVRKVHPDVLNRAVMNPVKESFTALHQTMYCQNYAGILALLDAISLKVFCEIKTRSDLVPQNLGFIITQNSNLSPEDKAALTTIVADRFMFYSQPELCIKTRALEFIAFMENYIKRQTSLDPQEIIMLKRAIAECDKAIAAHDSKAIRIRDKLLMLMGQANINVYEQSKSSDVNFLALHTTIQAFSKISPTLAPNISTEDHSLMGITLTEMGDQPFGDEKQESKVTDNPAAYFYGAVKNYPDLFARGLQHLKMAADKDNEAAVEMLNFRLFPTQLSKEVKKDEVEAKFIVKYLNLARRSQTLEEMGWNKLSDNIIKILPGSIYFSKEESMLLGQLLKNKINYEIETDSKKQKDILDNMLALMNKASKPGPAAAAPPAVRFAPAPWRQEVAKILNDIKKYNAKKRTMSVPSMFDNSGGAPAAAAGKKVSSSPAKKPST